MRKGNAVKVEINSDALNITVQSEKEDLDTIVDYVFGLISELGLHSKNDIAEDEKVDNSYS
jgi:cell division protein ZapA (FtsZ GTPase activity inhibitor)